ncbi:hypothetical protein QQ045_017680 [Rhodiola kirilowii]
MAEGEKMPLLEEFLSFGWQSTSPIDRNHGIEIRKFAQKAMGTKDVRVDVKLNKQIWSKDIFEACQGESESALSGREMMTKMQRRSFTLLLQ